MHNKSNINNLQNYIIAGGGTGGHIFPAIAIADAIKQKQSASNILFVGAKGRMEMEKVPQAGYNIIGLEVVGIQRRLTIKNLTAPIKLFKSIIEARKIIKTHQPSACIGVGGYASFPILFTATLMRIPIYIQEQNSYPGIANKILSNFAKKIFVAYDNLENFFNPNKIVLTGNPIRQDIFTNVPSKLEAYQFFNLNENKKTILVIGGSLGAKTINDAIEKNIPTILDNNFQLLWQTGKSYYDSIIERNKNIDDNIKIHQFIKEMNYAYTIADVIISRAGALSIAELCVIGKPCIFIPSPNVTEDHQTKNAMALVNKHAAILVKDMEAKEKLGTELLNLLSNKNLQEELSKNIKQLSKTNAANEIASEIINNQFKKIAFKN